MKLLINQTVLELNHLSTILAQIEQPAYCKTYSELNGSSIGMHMRHILEFFEALLFSVNTGVNYDNRERKLILEENPLVAFEFIERLSEKLNLINADQDVIVFSEINGLKLELKSSLLREIHYNLEHTTHHLAMIKVVVTKYFPNIELDQHAGFAYSTIQNKELIFAQTK
jgi:hypothetical protein